MTPAGGRSRRDDHAGSGPRRSWRARRCSMTSRRGGKSSSESARSGGHHAASIDLSMVHLDAGARRDIQREDLNVIVLTLPVVGSVEHELELFGLRRDADFFV